MKLYDWNGEQLTIDEISARTGTKSSTIRGRLRRGADITAAATEPTDRKRRVKFRDEMLTIEELSTRMGIPMRALYDNLDWNCVDDETIMAIVRREQKKLHDRQMIGEKNRMRIAEKIRDSLYGSTEPGRPEIRRRGNSGGLAFGEGFYRIEIGFMGENRVVAAAIFRSTGQVSARWEYRIENGRLALEERQQTAAPAR